VAAVTDIVRIGDATLYHGDCLEILPTLGKFDAVITDPPYGVGYAEWDDKPMMDWMPLIDADTIIVCSGIKNMFLWPRPFWVGAYSFPKGEKRSMGGGINCWEPLLIYGKNKLPLDHKQFPPIASEKVDGHPCPKPLAPFRWIVSKAVAHGAIAIDPFMGSGTTGVACAQLGRKFTGIEIERKYFDIACERIERAYAQGQLIPHEPAPHPVQQGMAL
jgi:site-specific DNA-methyltransferase (adenine-specific)